MVVEVDASAELRQTMLQLRQKLQREKAKNTEAAHQWRGALRRAQQDKVELTHAFQKTVEERDQQLGTYYAELLAAKEAAFVHQKEELLEQEEMKLKAAHVKLKFVVYSLTDWLRHRPELNWNSRRGSTSSGRPKRRMLCLCPVTKLDRRNRLSATRQLLLAKSQ
jgi:hypothetical protein